MFSARKKPFISIHLTLFFLCALARCLCAFSQLISWQNYSPIVMQIHSQRFSGHNKNPDICIKNSVHWLLAFCSLQKTTHLFGFFSINTANNVRLFMLCVYFFTEISIINASKIEFHSKKARHPLQSFLFTDERIRIIFNDVHMNERMCFRV